MSWATPASRPRLHRRWPGFTGWGCPSTRNQSGCLEPWTSESPEPVRHCVRQWAHEKFSQIACHSTDYLSTSPGGRPLIAVHFPLKYLQPYASSVYEVYIAQCLSACPDKGRCLFPSVFCIHASISGWSPPELCKQSVSPAVRLFDWFSCHKRMWIHGKTWELLSWETYGSCQMWWDYLGIRFVSCNEEITPIQQMWLEYIWNTLNSQQLCKYQKHKDIFRPA